MGTTDPSTSWVCCVLVVRVIVYQSQLLSVFAVLLEKVSNIDKFIYLLRLCFLCTCSVSLAPSYAIAGEVRYYYYYYYYFFTLGRYIPEGV